jgi:hypothetical protein
LLLPYLTCRTSPHLHLITSSPSINLFFLFLFLLFIFFLFILFILFLFLSLPTSS